MNDIYPSNPISNLSVDPRGFLFKAFDDIAQNEQVHGYDDIGGAKENRQGFHRMMESYIRIYTVYNHTTQEYL